MMITINPKPEDTKSHDFALIVIKGGFPHSEIIGSKLIRSSPTLIAAYHVLHRLCMPRHPPDALKTLDHSHCRYLFKLFCKAKRHSLNQPIAKQLMDQVNTKINSDNSYFSLISGYIVQILEPPKPCSVGESFKHQKSRKTSFTRYIQSLCG